jgi:hypothetical protein
LRVTTRTRVFAASWFLAWAAAGLALVLYRGLVLSEGPCPPGWTHCGMAVGHPLAWLGIVIWVVGGITSAILWRLASHEADLRKPPARPPASH